MKLKCNIVDTTALILLLIGGLNWGLAVFDVNAVSLLANATFKVLGKIIYGLVGLSFVWLSLRLATRNAKLK